MNFDTIFQNINDTLGKPLEFLGGVTLGQLVSFGVTLIVAVIIARVIRLYMRRTLKEKMPQDTLTNIQKVTYYTIITIGFLIGLNILGVSLSGVLVAGGIIGIVIGFASQTAVTNIISGLFLLIEKPLKVGDAVNIDGIDGIVKDIRVLSTTIRTYDGIYTRFPNQKVFSSNIKNYVAHGARRFGYTIGIRYKDDANRATSIIKDILSQHHFVLVNPEPIVYVEQLGDNSVNLTIKIWSPSKKWWDVYIEMLWKLKMALEQDGIQIPFPQRVVWFADKDITKEIYKDS